MRTFDPLRTFAQKCAEVCFGGLIGLRKTPVTAPISELPIGFAKTFGRAQHPRSAITADYMGPNYDNGHSITPNRAVILPIRAGTRDRRAAVRNGVVVGHQERDDILSETAAHPCCGYPNVSELA